MLSSAAQAMLAPVWGFSGFLVLGGSYLLCTQGIQTAQGIHSTPPCLVFLSCEPEG